MRRLALSLALLAAGCSYPTDKYTLGGGDAAAPDVPTGNDVPSTDMAVLPDAPTGLDVPITTDAGTDGPVTMDAGTDGPVTMDAGADIPVDTGTDVPTTDTGTDVPTTDRGVDVPTTDTGTDVPTTDTSCVAPSMVCGGVCVNTSVDMNHCGNCTTACQTNAGTISNFCRGGGCQPTCATGLAHCAGDGSAGCETNLGTPTNCGSCGRVCAASQGCVNTACYSTGYSRPLGFAGSFIDACSVPGHMNLLPNIDDGSNPLTLPFPFRFWGLNIPGGAMITVSSNGWIGMDGMPGNSLSGMLAQPSLPNSVIAPWWVDLVTGPLGVCVATLGAAPTRQLVIEWSGTTYFAMRAASLTFEAVLYESSNFIDFYYQSLPPTPPGYAATVGLENPPGIEGVAVCNGLATSCAITTGSRLRFTPTF